MNKLTIFRIFSVLLLVCMTLAAVSPAYADTHFLNEEEIDWTVLLTPGDPINPSPCDFDIQIHGYGTMRYNGWLDDYGRFTHGVDIYGNYKEDWSASGKTINIQLQGPLHWDIEYYADKIVVRLKTNGATLIATIPQYGIIQGGGGQIRETIILSPDWSTELYYSLDKLVGNMNWDWGPFCAYLAP